MWVMQLITTHLKCINNAACYIKGANKRACQHPVWKKPRTDSSPLLRLFHTHRVDVGLGFFFFFVARGFLKSDSHSEQKPILDERHSWRGLWTCVSSLSTTLTTKLTNSAQLSYRSCWWAALWHPVAIAMTLDSVRKQLKRLYCLTFTSHTQNCTVKH